MINSTYRLYDKWGERNIEQVANYLSQRYRGKFFLSETRAAIIPACSNLKYNGIKIKGCGFNGGPIKFGKTYPAPYSVPHYDFEGNYVRDAAKDHHRAFSGGMTYQQAWQEFNISSYLIQRNFDTFSPLGYGVIKYKDLSSWFCLLNFPFAPRISIRDLFLTDNGTKLITAFLAESQIQLHSLGVYLMLFGATQVNGKLIRKDFHTCVMASSNDSFVSRLCYFLFDINFILYHFITKKIPSLKNDKQKIYLACKEYIRGLSGFDVSMPEILEFKKLLLLFKTNTSMDIYKRLKVLQRNHIANQILMKFISEEEKAEFL